VVESTLPPNLILTTNNEPYTGPAGGDVPYPLGKFVPVGEGEDHDWADFGYAPCEECECIWPDDPRVQADIRWWIDLDGSGNPDTLTIRVTLNPTFADTAWGNMYDTGWPGKGRKFKQIWTSDNLEATILGADGAPAVQFGLDLLEPDLSAPSLFATAGPFGGDGYLGDLLADDVVSYDTSVSWNLNNHWPAVEGSDCYWDEKSSPAVVVDLVGDDYSYTSACETWIWETWYEITIDYAALDATGFSGVEMYGLHSSPSKTGDPTPECIVECWDVCP
jgi:hypothetical protein